jgi:hypothetical protein
MVSDKAAMASGNGTAMASGDGTAVPSPDGRALIAQESELPRIAGTVAAVWQFVVLSEVLPYLHYYRQPAVPIVVWLGLLAASAWLVPRARAGGLTGRQAAAAIAIAVAAVAVVGWDRRAHGAGGTVDWSVLGTGWLLALVAFSRPAWVWVSGALLVFATHAILAIHVFGVTSLSLARLAANAYTLAVALVVFGALRPTLRSYAGMAARRAALTSRLAAERAAAVAVQEDRRARLALLEGDALPLLRGIADGTLDPADSEVLRRCARHAATLRRALADRAQQAEGLLAGLEPALRAARARGLPVEVRVVGDPGHTTPEVAGAALAAVGGVLSELPPQPVTLTVLAAGDDVELYVTFERPPPDVPGLTGPGLTGPATACCYAAADVDDNGAGCLEVRWRKAVPP